MQSLFHSATKIRPPRMRPDFIARHALAARLRDALVSKRLVLLSAPAGFGKTALLAQQLPWLATACALAWYTVDAHDDLARTVVCLADALEPCDLPWRTAPEALAERAGTRAGLFSVADEFANTLEMTAATRGLMVIDDAHNFANVQALDFLGALIAKLPPNWTIAVTTRVDPPWPLASMHVRGDIAEFRESALRFTREETQALADAAGKRLPAPVLDQVFEQTRGWPVGVILSLDASRHLERVDHRLARRHQFEYLASEVLRDMPAELRDFLVRCSVLHELTAQRCRDVSGIPEAARLLEEVERRGLFVSALDGSELTLRLHDLFREFLAEVLRREHAADRTDLLHRAAHGESDPMRRIAMLLQAGDPGQAQADLLEAAPQLLTTSSAGAMLNLIEQAESASKRASPITAFLRGQCAIQRSDWQAAGDWMHQAADGWRACEQAALAGQARAYEALGLMAGGDFAGADRCLAEAGPDAVANDRTLFNYLWYFSAALQGRIERSAAHLDRLIDELPQPSTPQSRHQLVAAVTVCLVFAREDIPAILDRLDGATRAALAESDDPQTLLRTAAHLLSAWLLACRGHIEEAQARWEQAQFDFRWIGSPQSIGFTNEVLHALFAALQGDAVQTRAIWAALVEHLRQGPPGFCRYALAMAALHLAGTDDPEGARAFHRDLENSPGMDYPSTPLMRRGVPALLDLQEGRAAAAAVELRALCTDSVPFDHLGMRPIFVVGLARAELRQGDPHAAWAVLAPMLERVRAGGGMVGLQLAGHAALAELVGADWQGQADAQGLQTLREVFSLCRRPAQPAVAGPGATAGQPKLTRRELDVLSRIARGASNKVIARELDLSPHTVKRHVARILDRLDLQTRAQAAHWFAQNAGQR